VSAQAVEINGLLDDLDDLDFNSMALGEDIVSNPAIFDTGASHSFTGSKFFLHNFHSLKIPIPVSIVVSQSFLSKKPEGLKTQDSTITRGSQAMVKTHQSHKFHRTSPTTTSTHETPSPFQ
jgi:hypothetical protein